MSEPIALGDLDLTALVSSRICHDIINPVSAISNGLEMLAEEPDDEMRAAAMDLILKSATQASAKLQFARIAFGAAGSAGAEIDTRDAEKVAQEFVKTSEKHDLVWEGPALILPKNKVKLMLNLVGLGVAALPRGGTVRAVISGEGSDVSFAITATGKAARLSEQVQALLSGDAAVEVDAHTIQPYYASRVAQASGMTVTAASGEDEVTLAAR
ncbi:MAG: histidine phosphotransferase family protein [Pseudomonadota bacterium]